MILDNPVVQRGVRYKLAFKKLKKFVLAVKPRSEHELKHRIEEYLRLHPKHVIIFSGVGKTVDGLVGKLSKYAK